MQLIEGSPTWMQYNYRVANMSYFRSPQHENTWLSMQKLGDFLKSHGIQFYYTVVGDKSQYNDWHYEFHAPGTKWYIYPDKGSCIIFVDGGYKKRQKWYPNMWKVVGGLILIEDKILKGYTVLPYTTPTVQS